MTLGDKQREFTPMVAKLITFAYAKGYKLTFGEAFRTDEQQALHLKSGKSKVKRSQHQDRLAVDFNLFKEGVYLTASEDYAELGMYWKSLHPDNRWGGDFAGFHDGNHFEHR
ncbi:M15 family metallopeptidase [Candidatus Magnetobacterium casense]|uniref:M15 family metallopeptidase n=1 Tax=Candidatus Magnetobacterium casense TaxID=1455061 RepID=A0ABS6RUY3_9BACT|nr:M15 family metallopeptidase [Candidatus Magnetobacterium casensis]MBV6340439.1 M15 family metallopeptidase [Candidatus Magnetobacterium casensis]